MHPFEQQGRSKQGRFAKKVRFSVPEAGDAAAVKGPLQNKIEGVIGRQWAPRTVVDAVQKLAGHI
jgi:hypothetical protein